MDLLVMTMVIVMVMVTPVIMVLSPDTYPALQTKVRRESLVVAVAVVMAVTTFITISIVASQPTPQRIAVHWSAVMDPLVMAMAICTTIIKFLYAPPPGAKEGPIGLVITFLFTAVMHIAVHIAIAIAMHISMYALPNASTPPWGFPTTTNQPTVTITVTSVTTITATVTTVAAVTTVTATTKEMLIAIGAIVLWVIIIIIAPIYFLKVEVPVAYKNGTCGYSPLP